MRGICLLFLTFLIVEVLPFNLEGLQDTTPCWYVGDQCPIRKKHSHPYCHVDDQPVECREIPGSEPKKYSCWKYGCAYCHAKAFGCSTDLVGGAGGQIAFIETIESTFCGNPEIINPGTWKVHCGCGGGCIFSGTYRVHYTTLFPPREKIVMWFRTSKPLYCFLFKIKLLCSS